MKIKKWTLQILTCPPLLLQLARRLLGNKVFFSSLLLLLLLEVVVLVVRFNDGTTCFEEYYWESRLSCVFKTFLGFFIYL